MTGKRQLEDFGSLDVFFARLSQNPKSKQLVTCWVPMDGDEQGGHSCRVWRAFLIRSAPYPGAGCSDPISEVWEGRLGPTLSIKKAGRRSTHSFPIYFLFSSLILGMFFLFKVICWQ